MYVSWHLVPGHNVSTFSGAPQSTGLCSQVGATRIQDTEAACGALRFAQSHHMSFCSLQSGRGQPGLCPEKASPSQKLSIWARPTMPYIGSLSGNLGKHSTFTYSDMFIMGYRSLCLRMGHLGHFPLYSESFLKGRTARHLPASPQFPAAPDTTWACWWNKAKLSQ